MADARRGFLFAVGAAGAILLIVAVFYIWQLVERELLINCLSQAYGISRDDYNHWC